MHHTTFNIQGTQTGRFTSEDRAEDVKIDKKLATVRIAPILRKRSQLKHKARVYTSCFSIVLVALLYIHIELFRVAIYTTPSTTELALRWVALVCLSAVTGFVGAARYQAAKSLRMFNEAVRRGLPDA